MRNLINGLILAATALVGFGLSTHGHAVPATIIKIADTNTPIPGRAETFTSFSVTASSAGDDVAFIGFGPAQYSCVCARIDGTLSVLADRETAIPETAFTFDRFGEVSIDGGVVAFLGFGGTPPNTPESGSTGIYVSDGGALAVAVDNFFPISSTTQGDANTLIPGGNILSPPLPQVQNVFRVLSDVSVRGNTVLFTGVGFEDQSGIYTSTAGAPGLVIDTNSLIPASADNFADFANPAPDGGTLTFSGIGTGGQRGIYTTDGAATTVVVDTSTTVPGATGTFAGLFRSWLDASNVAFVGQNADGEAGVYFTSIGGVPRVVADRNTQVPGTGANFADVDCASVEGEKILFSTVVQGNFYLEEAGVLGKIVAVGDTLDGKIVQALECDDGLRGNTFSFVARFTDGSSGVYLARLEAVLRLVEGDNLTKLSILISGVVTSRELLNFLGTEAVAVTQFDPASGTVVTTTRAGNGFQGPNFQIDYAKGLILTMASDKQVPLTGSLLTSEAAPVPGVNLYAPLSISPGLDAHGLLANLASSVDVSSISRLNTSTRRFETAVRTAAGVMGANFPIVELEAYLLSVR